MKSVSYLQLLSACVHAARASKTLIRSVVLDTSNVIDKKTSTVFDDPQTEADVRSQHLIVNSLERKFKGLHIVGEEDLTDETNDLNNIDFDDIVDLDISLLDDLLPHIPTPLQELAIDDVTVWVDPLDGTKEYTLGVVENVTTLIGISYRGFALAGVVSVPFCDQLLYGGLYVDVRSENITLIPNPLTPNQAAMKHPYWSRYLNIHSQTPGLSPDSDLFDPTVVTSRHHMTPAMREILDSLHLTKLVQMGGAGNKAVRILEGVADAYMYPQTGTKRWDSCAIEALLQAYGGNLTDSWGNLYGYYRNEEDKLKCLEYIQNYDITISECGEGEKLHTNTNGVLATLVNHSKLQLTKAKI